MVLLRMTWALAASILFLEVSTILAQHQIVCSGQAAGGYAAFPDVCRLPNGELFCVFYSGYGHVSTPSAKWPKGGRIMAVRSSDNGQSWSRPFVVIDTDQDDRDPSVASLKNGTLLLTKRGLGFAVGKESGSPGCSERTFGHTGSTGTLCWADRASETICVVLTSLPARAVQPHPSKLAAERVAAVSRH